MKDPSRRLSAGEEKARYETHNNDVSDPRYRDFVRPLFDLVSECIPPGRTGLDFGAGSGPVLSLMLQEAGYAVRQYDTFFWPDPSVLSTSYDFIVASEVMEHLYDPAAEFRRLRELLRPGGLLGVMTLLIDDKTDLSSWYYLKDPTHVVFYSRRTFEWIARRFGFSDVEFRDGRTIRLIAAD